MKSLSGIAQQEQQIKLIWIDNAFKTSNNKIIQLVSDDGKSFDTIRSQWKSTENDTLYFILTKFKNPVHFELISDTVLKKSNKFNLIPMSTYTLTEYDNRLEIKAKPIIFDALDSKAQFLYAFLIKLFIELLVAIPVAALLRLPARLLFFVFVANVMTFPLVYITFIPINIKELISIFLEGFFIFLIGWKRLKLWKALLVSILINVIRFGIFKIVMLIIKIL